MRHKIGMVSMQFNLITFYVTWCELDHHSSLDCIKNCDMVCYALSQIGFFFLINFSKGMSISISSKDIDFIVNPFLEH